MNIYKINIIKIILVFYNFLILDKIVQHDMIVYLFIYFLIIDFGGGMITQVKTNTNINIIKKITILLFIWGKSQGMKRDCETFRDRCEYT